MNTNMNFIVCPQCSMSANYILTQSMTITACSYCCQATVMEKNIIIKLDKTKIERVYPNMRDFIAIALTAEMLYSNWNTIAQRVSS